MSNKELKQAEKEIRNEPVKVLLDIAKAYGIIGRHKMTKEQLIKAIVAAEKQLQKEQKETEKEVIKGDFVEEPQRVETPFEGEKPDYDKIQEEAEPVDTMKGNFDELHKKAIEKITESKTIEDFLIADQFFTRSELPEEIKIDLTLLLFNQLIARNTPTVEPVDDLDYNEQPIRDAVSSPVHDQPSDDCEPNDAKQVYLKNAEEGVIIAFKNHLTNRVKSAKILLNDCIGEVMRVETAYGKVFTVPYSEILWVKTGTRWPFGVYNALKGVR